MALVDAAVPILQTLGGGTVRPYLSHDFGRAQDREGRSIVLPRPQAETLLPRIREKLPPGLIAYVGTSRWLGNEKHGSKVELAVGPGRSSIDALLLARSDAVNHGLETEALVARISALHERLDLDVVEAMTDIVAFTFSKDPPDGWKALAKEIYALCPDIVDQGSGSMDELEELLRSEKRVSLWWD